MPLYPERISYKREQEWRWRDYLEGFCNSLWRDDFSLDWGGIWGVTSSKDRKNGNGIEIHLAQPIKLDDELAVGCGREE